MKEIKLISKRWGLVSQVDDQDFDALNQFIWHPKKDNKSGTFYAIRRKTIDGKETMIIMHRVILGITDPKILTDHKDGDGLNNQRSNIRPATSSQNNANVVVRINTSSKYKGVYFLKKYKKWRVYISFGRVRRNIGYFRDETEAAKAYNLAAIQLHGEFARLNQVPA